MNQEIIIQKICNIGDSLLTKIDRKDSCRKLVELVLDAKPTDDYPFTPEPTYLANELGLMDDELEELLIELDQKVKKLFLLEKETAAIDLINVDIRKVGSAFYFYLSDGKTFAFKTWRHLNFSVGDEVMLNFLHEEFHNRAFRVGDRLIEIGVDKILTVYFLTELNQIAL